MNPVYNRYYGKNHKRLLVKSAFKGRKYSLYRYGLSPAQFCTKAAVNHYKYKFYRAYLLRKRKVVKGNFEMPSLPKNIPISINTGSIGIPNLSDTLLSIIQSKFTVPAKIKNLAICISSLIRAYKNYYSKLYLKFLIKY